MMTMLREKSRNIQFEAFHVFKVKRWNDANSVYISGNFVRIIWCAKNAEFVAIKNYFTFI